MSVEFETVILRFRDLVYSRVIVDVDTLENGITQDTEYMLANTFAASYWLPMRADVSPKHIKIEENQVATYTVQMPRKLCSSDCQLSLFEEESI